MQVEQKASKRQGGAKRGAAESDSEDERMNNGGEDVEVSVPFHLSTT